MAEGDHKMAVRLASSKGDLLKTPAVMRSVVPEQADHEADVAQLMRRMDAGFDKTPADLTGEKANLQDVKNGRVAAQAELQEFESGRNLNQLR
jgi:hypothetical protein